MALSVFQRLSEAVDAAEKIPAIIDEINSMLPDGYCVTQIVQPMPEIDGPIYDEDMSDWRNWQIGDRLEIIDEQCGHRFNIGSIVEIVAKTNHDMECQSVDGKRWCVIHSEARFYSSRCKEEK